MKNEDSMSTANGKMSRIEVLSRQILVYLQEHPEAGDTLKGIAAWWLEQQRIEQLVEEVAEALELLIKQGTVRVYKTLSGTAIYKIKPPAGAA